MTDSYERPEDPLFVEHIERSGHLRDRLHELSLQCSEGRLTHPQLIAAKQPIWETYIHDMTELVAFMRTKPDCLAWLIVYELRLAHLCCAIHEYEEARRWLEAARDDGPAPLQKWLTKFLNSPARLMCFRSVSVPEEVKASVAELGYCPDNW